MEYKQIQEIISNFDKSKMTYLEIEEKNFKLKLSKNKGEIIQEKIIEKVAKSTENAATVKQTDDKKADNNSGFEVKSPLVGTFYAASSPTDEPFVKLNQKVEKGQTLCIIEAMKIMNEIIAPVSGTISSIKLTNGSAVGFDQVLMTII